MIDKPTIANPRTRYGAAKPATRQFIVQRLTGALNILFLGFLIWFVVSLAGAGREAMVATIRNPVIAIVLVLLVINVTVHMRIGILEVIEDYVDEGRRGEMARVANNGFAVLVAVLAIGAVAKIVFWG